MKKFGAGLTADQIKLARLLEKFEITTYSQAVKAMLRRDNEKISQMKKQLSEKLSDEGGSR